jgi:hypothetical protein
MDSERFMIEAARIVEVELVRTLESRGAVG